MPALDARRQEERLPGARGSAGAECGRAVGRAGCRVLGEGGAGDAVAAAAAAAVEVAEGGVEGVQIWLRSEAGRRRRGECDCGWNRERGRSLVSGRGRREGGVEIRGGGFEGGGGGTVGGWEELLRD
jgi:hypothetical protein